MLITVTLSIQGERLDPDAITTLLGVMPHVSRRKGDVRMSKTGKRAVAHAGLWEWRATEANETLPLSDQVHRLHRTFLNSIDWLRQLPLADDSMIDIHLVTDQQEDGDSSLYFAFDPMVLTALAAIGLPTTVTVDRITAGTH
jgi:hypothetical protein